MNAIKNSSVIILECLSRNRCSIPVMVLYKEYRINEGWFWGPPGGKIDAGETPIECAIRETKEEAYLPIKEEEMKYIGNYRGCGLWVVKIWDDLRKKMLDPGWFKEKRFGTAGLSKYQKEMHDITKVSMLEIRDAIRDNRIWVTDLDGKKIKLRNVFFKELVNHAGLRDLIGG